MGEAEKKAKLMIQKLDQLRGKIPPELFKSLRAELQKLEKEAREADANLAVRNLQKEIEKLRQSLSSVSQTPKITILSPQAGTKVKGGEKLEIKWQTTGFLGEKLKIILFKHGHYYREIITVQTDAGSYGWTISQNLSPDGDYQIVVWDPTTNAVAFSEFFSIIE
jgi:hypothetical protein